MSNFLNFIIITHLLSAYELSESFYFRFRKIKITFVLVFILSDDCKSIFLKINELFLPIMIYCFIAKNQKYFNSLEKKLKKKLK